MTTTVTKESLAARIAELESGQRSLKEDYTLAAYKMLLATMEAEPVAYVFKHPAGRLFWSLTDGSNKGQNDVMPVYASPQPAPVVPDEMPCGGAADDYHDGYQDGWNAYRAAMPAPAQQEVK